MNISQRREVNAKDMKRAAPVRGEHGKILVCNLAQSTSTIGNSDKGSSPKNRVGIFKLALFSRLAFQRLFAWLLWFAQPPG